MPQGRHRHAPPLHRLLAPSAVAAVALACAGGAWLVGGPDDPGVSALRVLAAGAAAAAVTGAGLLRRWDREAGRRVGEVRAAKATAEWRAEERQAELETELEESQEIRRGVETELRRKRAELDRLRTEHAALLRRYATAETERASALEGRRQLALEAAGPAKALTTGAADHRRASGAPTPLTYLQANEALGRLRTNVARQREREEEERARERAERVAAREEAEREEAARKAGAPAPDPARQRQPWGRARQPYGQGPGGSESTAPKRGFDFFGTQRRRRAPGTPHNPAESPSDQDDDRHRDDRPEDARPGGAARAESRPDPAAVPRATARAVAGKVIDLGGPDPAEGTGDSAGADAPHGSAGRAGKPRRTRA